MLSQGKILITGAAGFISSHLVDLLLSEGVAVSRLRLLVLPGESLENLPKRELDIIWGDIRNKNVVKKAMKGVTTIYHLAARVDFGGKTYEEYKATNVEGTQNLLNECEDKKIQKFVFFSSMAVYGMPADVGDIINWNETRPHKYTNYYGRSKHEAESRVIRAFRKWGIPYAIIRPAQVYGPRDKGATYELYRAIRNRRFVMIGNGDNKMHYIYVTDLVKGARQAQLSWRKEGDYILAGPKPLRFTEIVECIAASLGMPVPTVRISKPAALGLSYVADFISKLFRIRMPIYPSRVRTMTTTYFFDTNKAKKEIGFDPKIDFKKGAKMTGAWYIRNKYL